MFKQIRVSYWIIIGFFKKHTRLLLFGIIIGISSFTLLPKVISIFPKKTSIEKIAVIGRPTLSEIPLFIQKQISQGLTQINSAGETLPSLAKNYKIEANGKRFVFFLRDDITWHDGKPLTADDINYNFSDVEIQTPSSHEIAFSLKDPFSPFPMVVSQPIFHQKKTGIFKNNISLLGVGKMKVEKIERQGNHITQLTLKSEEKKIIYRFYNTEETAILAFKLGEVDKILELSSPRELANWTNTTIQNVIHYDRYVAVFFNNDSDLLSSKRLRQALTYAISLKPTGEQRVISPINPNSWAFNPQVKLYEFDLETARKLLEEEMEENQNLNLNIELTTTLPHLKTAELIKEDWNNIGFNTTVKVLTYLPDSFQALLIAQEIPPDPDQYIFWHSIQNTNLTKYNSPMIDKLLEDGRQTLDIKERTQIYQDFQRFLVEDSPAAFLYHHETFTVTRS